MRSSSILFVAVAALAQFVAATPPACLIAAVGVQANPADTKVLCGTGKDWVVGNITESCSGDSASALSTFKTTCASAGYTITLPSATATATSASKTASSSASKTSSASSTTASASDEEDVSDVWDGAATNATKSSDGSNATASNATALGSPQTGAGAALSTGSTIFLGSMLAAAGLASQYLL